jgi:hypothetical protein
MAHAQGAEEIKAAVRAGIRWAAGGATVEAGAIALR